MRDAMLYIRATRYYWTSASTFSVTLGLTLAWELGAFSLPWSLAAWVSLFVAHCAMQVWDELLDYRLYRAAMYREGRQEIPTHFSGGSGVLTGGHLRPRQLAALLALLILVFAGFAVAAVQAVGVELLLMILAGILWSFGYAAPPLKLSYRGLGELGLLVLAGPLITLGVAFGIVRVATPEAAFAISPRMWAIAFVPGLIQFAQVFWGALVDEREDAAAGKRNLTVRFGTKVTLSIHLAAIALALLVVLGLSVRDPWLVPAVLPLAYGLREACWALAHRRDRDAVAARLTRHPLYRSHALTCAALVVGLVVHGLLETDASVSGAATLVALAFLSWSVGWRFYFPPSHAAPKTRVPAELGARGSSP